MIKYIRYCFYSNGTSVNKTLEKKKTVGRLATFEYSLACIYIYILFRSHHPTHFLLTLVFVPCRPWFSFHLSSAVPCAPLPHQDPPFPCNGTSLLCMNLLQVFHRYT